jgi:hypothetical protein
MKIDVHAHRELARAALRPQGTAESHGFRPLAPEPPVGCGSGPLVYGSRG